MIMNNVISDNDTIITVTAADGTVRMTACESTKTCEEARRIHSLSPVAAAALGRTLTAAALMSSQLKNETDSVTLNVCGRGPLGSILCVSDVHANVRGYVTNPAADLPLRETDGKLDVGGAVGKGFLRVIKDLSMKEPYVGTSALVSGEIGEDLSYYFATSEQVPSSVAVGVRIRPDENGKEAFVVDKAGGFILQLMPGADEKLIDTLETRISCMPSVTTLLSAGASITDVAEDVLKDFSPQIKEKKCFSYKCGCSRERMLSALAAIGRKDLEEIYADGKGAELCCHFCNKKYFFGNDEILALLGNGTGA